MKTKGHLGTSFSNKERGKDKPESNFDKSLNEAIEKIENALPTDWAFVLSYIDSEATIPARFFSTSISSEALAKEAHKRKGKAEIFFRLARVSSKAEEYDLI
ncbi:MAG: hypothetical protein HRT47_01470 [Candidatus Caenarcaniphilales bacterium]|nr:hypothetical protein [Candidatus Caenarcaniphilales bacterium]